MVKYAIKRPTTTDGVWEWKMINNTSGYAVLENFDTMEAAEQAKNAWAPSNGVIVESKPID